MSHEETAHLEAEIERLRRWLADLQSGLYVNCVYCGHNYGPRASTPVAMADVLKRHIAQCPEHPLKHALDALEPFARAAAVYDGRPGRRDRSNLPPVDARSGLTVGDLRDARVVYAEILGEALAGHLNTGAE